MPADKSTKAATPASPGGGAAGAPDKPTKAVTPAVPAASAGGGKAGQLGQAASVAKAGSKIQVPNSNKAATGAAASGQPSQAAKPTDDRNGPPKSNTAPEKSDKAGTGATQAPGTAGGPAAQPAQAAKTAEDAKGPSNVKATNSNKAATGAAQAVSAAGGTAGQPSQAAKTADDKNGPPKSNLTPEKLDKTATGATQGAAQPAPAAKTAEDGKGPSNVKTPNSSKVATGAAQAANVAGGAAGQQAQAAKTVDDRNGPPKSNAPPEKPDKAATGATQAAVIAGGPTAQLAQAAKPPEDAKGRSHVKTPNSSKAATGAAQAASAAGGNGGQGAKEGHAADNQNGSTGATQAVGQPAQAAKAAKDQNGASKSNIPPENPQNGPPKTQTSSAKADKKGTGVVTAVQLEPVKTGGAADVSASGPSDKAVTNAVQVATSAGGTAGQLVHAVKIAENKNGPSKIMTAARIAGAAAVIQASASKKATMADKAQLAGQAASRAAITEGASPEVAKAAAAAAAQAAGASGHDLEHAVVLSDRSNKETPAEAELLTNALKQGEKESEKQKAAGKGTILDHVKIAGNAAAEFVIKKGGTPELAIEAAKSAAKAAGGTEDAINQLAKAIKAKHGAAAFSSERVASLYKDDDAPRGLKVEVAKAIGLDARAFCSGEISGKPESKFQTTDAPNVAKTDSSGEPIGTEWTQSFQVEDFIDGDTIEFSIFDETKKLVATTGFKCWECEDGLMIELPMNGTEEQTKKPSSKATEPKAALPQLRIKVHSTKIAQQVAIIANFREGFESVCKELATEREEWTQARNAANSSKDQGSATMSPATVKSSSVPASKNPAAGQTREEKLRDIFRICDQQGGGSINKRELIKVVRSDDSVAAFFGLSRQLHQEDGALDALTNLFQKIDADKDTMISWEEFRSFYMEEVAPTQGTKQNNEVRFELEDGPTSEANAGKVAPEVNIMSQGNNQSLGLKPPRKNQKKNLATGNGSAAPSSTASTMIMTASTGSSAASSPGMASSASSPALSTSTSLSTGPTQTGRQVSGTALKVTLHSAMFLPNGDQEIYRAKGLHKYSDSYCIVKLGTGIYGSTKDLINAAMVGREEQGVSMMTRTISDTLDPVWDESSTFSYNSVHKRPLIFKVMDEDGPSKWDDLLAVGALKADQFWPSGTGKDLVEIPLTLPEQFEKRADGDPFLRVKIEVLQEWQGEEKTIKLTKNVPRPEIVATYVLPKSQFAADGSQEPHGKFQFGTSTFNHLSDKDKRGRGWWNKESFQKDKVAGKCSMCKTAGSQGRSEGFRVNVTECPRCRKSFCHLHILTCGVCKKCVCNPCNDRWQDVHRIYSSIWRCDKCDDLTRNSGAGNKSKFN